MRHDPIVDEVRKAREEILAECGGDLDQLAQRLRGEREHYAARLVTIDQMRQRKSTAGASAETDRSRLKSVN